jgi:hypothetical protein
MTDLRHLAQDLRAEAHRAPDDIAAMMRQAATALDRFENFVPVEVMSAPIPPPGDPRNPRAKVKGAPC